MNTLLIRLHALRLNAPIALLILLLQRTPVLQTLVRADVRIPVFAGSLLRSAFVVAASGSAVHTLTGATQFTSNPASPTTATVGTPFALVFAVTGAPSAPKSYKITGVMPPGLTVPGMNSSGILNASSGSISGTPTQSGSYTTYIQAYELANASGNTNKVAYPVVINVAGGQTSPPAITSQPQSLTVTAGANASFSVTATGSPSPNYQWQKNGSDIGGATSATLSLTNVQSADAANYAAVVSNSAGSVTSNTATLTVNPATVAPAITSQPQSLTVTAGANASFSVTATGTPSPSYQWQKNGSNISGATSSTLSLTNVQAADAANYAAVISNSAGSVTSNTATLTVNAATVAPAITSQPQSLTVTAGANASFSVTATGTPSPSYQWQKNGANIGGATSATLSLTNVQSGDAANYAVVVSNSAGSVTSNTATLTVNPATVVPAITSQPQSLTVTAGTNASFSVTATGTPSPSYQWQKNGSNIGGATSATLSLTNVQSADAANYAVVVSNSAGSVTSNTATLTVNPATTAPAITSQPQSLTLVAGTSGNFSVTATGTPSPTYQWRKNGSNISGATSSTLSLTNVQSTDAANYTVVVSNSAGSVTSSTATLTVNAAAAAPTISSQPQSLTVTAGANASFSVTATGTPSPSYQWQKNGSNISGATAATLSLTNVQSADGANYAVVVSNSAGSVTSSAATLTVNAATAAPTITSQPQSLTLVAGTSGSFSVTATGTPSPTYQWRKNAANIAGATSATLSLTNVQSADAANYTVVVSNSAGSVTSSTATLTVNAAAAAPTISSQPQSLTVTAGANANFSVTATGTPSPSYQWRKNGSNISGATAATLSLTNVQSADAANYTVVVSNSAGSVTSSTATLTVNPGTTAPTITSLRR